MYEVNTIDELEIVDLKENDISPFISSCKVKVFYTGENRNRSSISKEVALKMAKTLRGNPIVGYYKEDKEDFADHGKKIVIEDGEIKFSCNTVPYGFIAPNANVWFQKFQELDEEGQPVVRDYLMTDGYLWTQQFKECQAVIDEGRPQSMELDEDTLVGEWTKSIKGNYELFIINDAIFSKLCILGNDVEPCFEGASITANFTKMNENFKNTLYSMIKDMQKIGGQEAMENNLENLDTVVESDNVENQEVIETTDVQVTDNSTADFEKKESEDEDEDKNEQDDSSPEDKDEDDEKKKAAENYSLLEANYNTLQDKYSQLQADYNKLLEFKKSVENSKKDELINSFYMLSDEDKKDVMENKENYSLDDIEAKLSVICVRKKVSFDLEKDNADKKQDNPEMLFSLESTQDSAPAWISALRNTKAAINI